MIEPCGMKWARLRQMIVDLFITISLCIKWLNLPWEIFLDSFCECHTVILFALVLEVFFITLNYSVSFLLLLLQALAVQR